MEKTFIKPEVTLESLILEIKKFQDTELVNKYMDEELVGEDFDDHNEALDGGVNIGYAALAEHLLKFISGEEC